MGRIRCLAVIVGMATEAQVRGARVIAFVTVETIVGNDEVGTSEGEILIVYGKGGRLPVGFRCMAILAGEGQSELTVGRVARSIIVGGVAILANC